MTRFIWFFAFCSILIISINCEIENDSDEYCDEDDDLSSDQIDGRCPYGWRLFRRPTGVDWCMKVFLDKASWNISQIKCNAHGAVLSGFQTEKEFYYIAEQGEKLLHKEGMKAIGAFWVGAAWRPECRNRYFNSNPTCANSYSINWTDNVTTGHNNFRWFPGRPTFLGNQNYCVVVTLKVDQNEREFGNLDLPCDHVKEHQNRESIRGFVCGKRA